MTRATDGLRLDGRGLEIGASFSPMVSKASGARVETLDHATKPELVEKYTGLGVAEHLIAQIEEVDHLWHGGSFLDVIPETGVYDFIIASHLIEHQVDLIRFLTDCEALLADDGVLSLVVPDKRFTFDHFLPLSSLGEVLENASAGRRFHPSSAVFDYHASSGSMNGALTWGPDTEGEWTLLWPDLAVAQEAAARALAQEEYIDVHRWRFTPESFAMLIDDLAELGLQHLEITSLYEENAYEFFVKLRKASGPVARRKGRIESFLAIDAELERASPTQRRLQTENERLGAALTAATADRAAMLNTLSWRVTKPLRAIRRGFRSS